MSWSAPFCPQCHTPTRFDSPVPDGPDLLCGLAWTCDRCQADVLELIPQGPTQPRIGHCLNCDDEIDEDGRCPDCRVDHGMLVARVHEHCGTPPQIEKIRALCESGLYRVALNAVHLRLSTNPEDVEALALCARLLLELHRPTPSVAFLKRAVMLEPGLAVQVFTDECPTTN